MRVGATKPYVVEWTRTDKYWARSCAEGGNRAGRRRGKELERGVQARRTVLRHRSDAEASIADAMSVGCTRDKRELGEATGGGGRRTGRTGRGARKERGRGEALFDRR